MLHLSNYSGSSSGGAGPLAGAGRLRPAAGSGTKASMRQPHDTLRDRTHLSQAHTQFQDYCRVRLLAPVNVTIPSRDP